MKMTSYVNQLRINLQAWIFFMQVLCMSYTSFASARYFWKK